MSHWHSLAFIWASQEQWSNFERNQPTPKYNKTSNEKSQCDMLLVVGYLIKKLFFTKGTWYIDFRCLSVDTALSAYAVFSKIFFVGSMKSTDWMTHISLSICWQDIQRWPCLIWKIHEWKRSTFWRFVAYFWLGWIKDYLRIHGTHI